MKDTDCVSFLQWCLPRLDYRWPGFRKVRGQVCKRVARRIKELGLEDIRKYRLFLEHNDEEWDRLDEFCRITISRFYRDRATFDALRDRLLPEVARRCVNKGRTHVDCWSAGCCSGEEPHTLKIIWRLSVLPATGLDIPLHIVASDADARLLERGRVAIYPTSSLKDLPDDLKGAFEEANGSRRVRSEFRQNIEWLRQDLRRASPGRMFDVVLCRNLAFTYYQESLQSEVMVRLHSALRDDGLLVIGSHEQLPSEASEFFRKVAPCVYERRPPEPSLDRASSRPPSRDP